MLESKKVIKEIERVLNFYRFSINKENEEVRHFIITGDHPLLEEFINILKSRLQGTVQLLPNAIACLPDHSPIPFSLHLAAGLGRKEVE
jgi:type IV pilus assembly protein PilM